MYNLSKRRSSFEFRIFCLLLYGLFLSVKVFFHHQEHAVRHVIAERDPFTEVGLSQDYEFHRHLLTIGIVEPTPPSNCTPLAMENFPRDLFNQHARQRGAVILHIIGAFYMFVALAVLCEEYFIPCLERICEVLKLQPDVAGATFMAAGSSAPELATTIVGVFIARDDIGLGVVVGSADFNVMLVISVTALFAKQVIYLNWWPVVRDCFFYLISIVVLALIIVDEFVHWYESLVLLILYVIYVAFMFLNPKIDAFWWNWCHQHPTCCPRAIHTDEEDQETLHQHSGAFVYLDSHLDGHQAKSDPYTPYAQLDESKSLEEIDDDLVTEMDTLPSTTLELETQIREPDDSWFETCFSPLRITSANGVRGKLRNAASLAVWPIRFVVCLTVPDVRKPRWRRSSVSHWISFVMCCWWIGFFTVIMMWMITVVGVTFHIPDTIMGLTFIAAGSSVPDAIVSVLVVREGEGDMAVANAVGSNVFDILICMGLPWFLKCLTSGAPVVIYSKGLLYAVLTLFSTVLFLLGVTHLNRWRLTKPYGVVLLIGYIVVLVFCSCYELNLFGIVHLPECPLVENR